MNIARLLVLGLLAAVVVGCASSGGSVSGADDPAAVVPASAPLYAEATVRPQGQGRADAQAVLGKVLGTGDPGAKLEARFDHAARAYGVTFKDDVEPWLDDRIAAAVTSPRSGRGDAILVLTCTDDAKARAAIDKLRGDFVGRSYQGVAYRYERKDAKAAALVDHNVVIGTEAGVKSAIDASKGTSLAQSSGLRDARAKVAQDRMGLLYADVQGAVLAATRGGDPQLAIAAQALALALPRTLAAAVVPDGDVVRLDAVSLGTPTQLSTGRSGADIAASLPQSSWLGLGVADLGKLVDGALQAVASAGGVNGIGVQALLGQLQQQTGLDLRKDLLSWMGDAGVFAGGTTAGDLRGGLVVRTTDPAATRRAIATIEGLVRKRSAARVSPLRLQGVDDGFSVRSGARPPIAVALAGDRFVVAAGEARALKEAIDPSAPGLGATPAFSDAAAKLGGGARPSFFLDLQQLGQLLRTRSSSHRAEPYLDAFGAVVGAAKDEGGGVVRGRFVITLR